MTEESYTKEEFHKKMAASLFNLTWDLLDKEERTLEEVDKMIHAAHASRFHWGEIGEPLHFERGEWQIARVYAVLNMPEPALYHAQRCLQICQENKIGDFDLAFAYEAVARAHTVAGQADKCREYIELAKKAGEAIEEEGNRDYFFSQLKTISCE